VERVLCRVDDDDYAADDAGQGAFIVSGGTLPLRTRTLARGVHHRPEFPGTAVVIGDARYEVMEQTHELSGRTCYALRPWPEKQLVRDQVCYGRELVVAVRRERETAARQLWGRRYLAPLHPLFGLLPEPLQIAACDRWGLDPVRATWTSGATEAVLLFAAWRRLDGIIAFALLPIGGGYMLTCLLRVLGALTVAEVAGSPVAAAAWWALRTADAALAASRERVMTREAFWARLARPDRQARTEGVLEVEADLPHLSWSPRSRVRGVGPDDWWLVEDEWTTETRGRRVYGYRLTAEQEPGGPAPAPPRPTAYGDAVLAEVVSGWDQLRDAGFGWIVSVLPDDVQDRALRDRGGAATIRLATAFSVAFTMAAAVWMAARPTALNLLTAAVLAFDAVRRGIRWGQGRYAPSLVGPALAGYMPPERGAYHTHRDRERAAEGAGLQ
jgi:hypothetical protein